MKCPNPECVNGKVKIEVPITSDVMGEEEVDCEVCRGAGEITEDLTPLIAQALYRAVELLESINKKLGGKQTWH